MKNRGFTIVELLVVIVVIGILAAITIVSYTGISSKATVASLVSDLDNASKQLNVFQVLNNAYPTVNVCPAVLSTDICLKASPGTTFTYTYNNSNSTPTFNLLATKGSTNYSITNNSSPTLFTPAVATGGTVTTDGRYRIHTFTTSGTLTVTTPGTAEVLVVGGGGGGGISGGGAGGYLTGTENLSGTITVIVGAGGPAGGIWSRPTANGGNSVFGSRTAFGGGLGVEWASNGVAGGSGSGGSAWDNTTERTGGAGTAGQGNDGGSNRGIHGHPFPSWAAGGGGAGSKGGDVSEGVAGNGGAGLNNDIILRGTFVGYAGGGAGARWDTGVQGTASHGGGANGGSGTANTGGGGGGSEGTGGTGGSGIVIIRYLTP